MYSQFMMRGQKNIKLLCNVWVIVYGGVLTIVWVFC